MEHIFASACLYRWDLPLSAFWVCGPALKGGCCFLQKHWVFVPGSSNQVLQVGRSAEGRKLLPGGGFPSGQEGFMKAKSGKEAGGIEDCHPSRASQRQHWSLRKRPPQPHLQRQTQDVFVGASVCGSVFPHPNLTMKRENPREARRKAPHCCPCLCPCLLHVTQPLLSGTEL